MPPRKKARTAAAAAAFVRAHRAPSGRPMCQRCFEPADGSPCRVPHHAMFGVGQQVQHMMTFGGGTTLYQKCQACQRTYTEESMGSEGGDTLGVTEGPRWCYEGEHTVDPLPAFDCRRKLAPDALRRDAFISSTKMLTSLTRSDGFTALRELVLRGVHDETVVVNFQNVTLPSLEVLVCQKLQFSQLTVTKDTVPALRYLRRDSIGCDKTCRAQFTPPPPGLQVLHLNYFQSDHHKAIKALLKAELPRLEAFTCYKLWVSKLALQSPALHTVYVDRSDSMTRMELTAPALRLLHVTGCFNLKRLKVRPKDAAFVAKIDNRAQLQQLRDDGNARASLIKLGESAQNKIYRVQHAQDSDDEDNSHPDDPFGLGGMMRRMMPNMGRGFKDDSYSEVDFDDIPSDDNSDSAAMPNQTAYTPATVDLQEEAALAKALGNGAFGRGDWSTAITKYREAHAMLVRCHSAAAPAGTSFPDVQEETDALWVVVNNNLAMAFYKRGEATAARSDFADCLTHAAAAFKAASAEGNDAAIQKALFRQGAAQLRLGRAADAVKSLQSVSNPDASTKRLLLEAHEKAKQEKKKEKGVYAAMLGGIAHDEGKAAKEPLRRYNYVYDVRGEVAKGTEQLLQTVRKMLPRLEHRAALAAIRAALSDGSAEEAPEVCFARGLCHEALGDLAAAKEAYAAAGCSEKVAHVQKVQRLSAEEALGELKSKTQFSVVAGALLLGQIRLSLLQDVGDSEFEMDLERAVNDISQKAFLNVEVQAFCCDAAYYTEAQGKRNHASEFPDLEEGGRQDVDDWDGVSPPSDALMKEFIGGDCDDEDYSSAMPMPYVFGWLQLSMLGSLVYGDPLGSRAPAVRAFINLVVSPAARNSMGDCLSSYFARYVISGGGMMGWHGIPKDTLLTKYPDSLRAIIYEGCTGGVSYGDRSYHILASLTKQDLTGLPLSVARALVAHRFNKIGSGGGGGGMFGEGAPGDFTETDVVLLDAVRTLRPDALTGLADRVPFAKYAGPQRDVSSKELLEVWMGLDWRDREKYDVRGQKNRKLFKVFDAQHKKRKEAEGDAVMDDLD